MSLISVIMRFGLVNRQFERLYISVFRFS